MILTYLASTSIITTTAVVIMTTPPVTSTTVVISPTTATKQVSNSGFSGALIAVAVVVPICVVVLILGLVYLCLRRRRSKSKSIESNMSDQSTNPDTDTTLGNYDQITSEDVNTVYTIRPTSIPPTYTSFDKTGNVAMKEMETKLPTPSMVETESVGRHKLSKKKPISKELA